MAGRHCSRDVLPFTAIVAMECTNVALNTLFKAATVRGMSRFVFIFYSYSIAALLLLPFPFIDRRRGILPPMSFSLLSKIGLLGLVGSTSQIAGFKGIEYSSPTLASAISNLTPAFTFILAIIFRMEKMDGKSSSMQAKIMGTIVSIMGAFIVTLYKGPTILTQLSPLRRQSVFLLPSSSSNWMTGGMLLVTEYSLISVWYIIQAHIMKEYPSELTIVFFYNLCVAMAASLVGSVVESDRTVWILHLDISLVSVLASGFFGSLMGVAVHTWALRLKGPVYVVMFKPLSVVIAVAMGVVFLGDILYLGSVVGATAISIGFYTVMWGKAKDEMKPMSGSSQNSPLLTSRTPHSQPNVLQ